MAKLPDPVKKKVAKSGVSRSAAIKKAQTAEAKASRGPVASKSRYPKMSTASGAAEAAKRGAGAARNAMGGFGKTKASPIISNEDKIGSQRNRQRAIAKKQSTARAEAAKPKRVTRGGNTGGFGATRKRSQSGGTVRSTQGRAMSKANKLY